MKYFLDNDISPHLAAMLRPLGVDIIALREVMPSNTKDHDFLGDLASKYFVDVFISNNTAQRTTVVEARLLKSSGVTSLYFGPFWSKKKGWAQAKWLINKWEMIDNFATSATRGSCADIKENGRMNPFQL